VAQNLPEWLTPLPDAESMRAVDRWAIEERGVPGVELMERAGAAVARTVERLAPDGRVCVVCGKGNNGGDGLVLARLLRETGREVEVVCVAPPGDYAGDARANLERLPGSPPAMFDDAGLAPASVIVDALLGTGFAGEPRGASAEAIAAINRTPAVVVAVDVPSGVDASSGVVAGEAVRADATVTFHAAKPGLWIRPGRGHAGAIETVDIGIPRGAPLDASVGLIEPAVLELIPRRGEGATKFSSGHVVVAGGSLGLTGAPVMCATASMRAGAGYVTVCVPSSVQAIVAAGATPELMTRGLPDAGGALTVEAVAGALEAVARGGALALGPGLGRREGAVGFARLLARQAGVPIVLDADGLNAHEGLLDTLAQREAATVLTPHAGELGRLLGLDSDAIEARRLEHVRAAAAKSGAVTLLKGDDTLIAEPGGRVAVNPGATPALATAGTGDVLTGVIAALLAKGLDPFAAAAAGACLHARAGREAARRLGGVEAVVASDVIAALPAARLADDPEGGA
jgi:ADP-dependent NAD(P)H-hydrate dehydratase / NAD(P)H-hydrate epimerase